MRKSFGAPRATSNAGLLEANLPVTLLSRNRAKVSQGPAVEVAEPYVVLQGSRHAMGVDLHAMRLRRTVRAVATEILNVLQEKGLEAAVGSPRAVPLEYPRCAGPSFVSRLE